jgi:hypothetical protein
MKRWQTSIKADRKKAARAAFHHLGLSINRDEKRPIGTNMTTFPGKLIKIALHRP